MPLLPQRATRDQFNIPMMVALVIVHVGALFAPFTFTWAGLAAFMVLWIATGCLGTTLCYHRLLSHRSFKTHKLVKYFLMFCGTLALEGDPTWWVATHRLHHRESDQEMDPHSPKVSFAWGHVLWLLFPDERHMNPEAMARFAPDLVNDPWAKFLARFFIPINLAVPVLLFAIGYGFADLKTAISMAVWGGFFRVAWVWHMTWSVNSFTHMYGYRNYETRDDSRNTWWVALLTYGEGWHNNHHANPSAVRAGHRWWEIDLTYGVIKLMQWTGLAWQLQPVVTGNTAEIKPLAARKRKMVQ